MPCCLLALVSVLALGPPGAALDDMADLEVSYTLAAPAEWRPIDELAAPARTAFEANGWIGGAEAWGEPTGGAFALAQELQSREVVRDAAAAARRLHDTWRAGLERSGARITGWAVGEGRHRIHSVATFERAAFSGAAHTYSMVDAAGSLRAVSAVCFYNRRSHQRSRRQCARLLDQFGPTVPDDELRVITARRKGGG